MVADVVSLYPGGDDLVDEVNALNREAHYGMSCLGEQVLADMAGDGISERTLVWERSEVAEHMRWQM